MTAVALAPQALHLDAPAAGDWTFAFVDLVGFTALTEREGDGAAAVVVARLQQATLHAAADTGVELVKTLGDGLLLVAETPVPMLRTVARLDAAWADAPLPPLRVGVHHGGAVRVATPLGLPDYVGGGVNVAARISTAARAGEVLATHEVAYAAGAAGLVAEPAGRRALRGITATVPLYRLVPCGEHALPVAGS